MKIRIFFIAVLSLVALSFLHSCSLSDGEQPAFPSYLSGKWIYTDASTGYIGILSIEDIAGGQYAYFALVSPVREVETWSEGSFIYDPTVGTGYISTDLTGAGTVSVIAYPTTDSMVEVMISGLTSEGSSVSFQETFYKAVTVNFTTGTWSGEKTVEGVTFEVLMDIISIEPRNGSCGTLTISAAGHTVVATITGFSGFILAYDNTAVGLMKVIDDETETEVYMVVLYDTLSKDVVISDFEGTESVTLSSVNVN